MSHVALRAEGARRSLQLLSRAGPDKCCKTERLIPCQRAKVQEAYQDDDLLKKEPSVKCETTLNDASSVIDIFGTMAQNHEQTTNNSEMQKVAQESAIQTICKVCCPMYTLVL